MPLSPDVYQGLPQHTFLEFRYAVLEHVVSLVELCGRLPSTQFVSDGRNEFDNPGQPYLTFLAQSDLYLAYTDRMDELNEAMRRGASYYGAIYTAFAYQAWRFRILDEQDREIPGATRVGFRMDEPEPHAEWLRSARAVGYRPVVDQIISIMYEEAREDGYGANVWTMLPLTYPTTGYGHPRLGFPRPKEYGVEHGDPTRFTGIGTRIVSERSWPPPSSSFFPPSV